VEGKCEPDVLRCSSSDELSEAGCLHERAQESDVNSLGVE
jgi:hypothetical protein